jgi:hypothetical protein
MYRNNQFLIKDNKQFCNVQYHSGMQINGRPERVKFQLGDQTSL